jgi:alpha-ketoglutarate-dependent taurine dioxygenase
MNNLHISAPVPARPGIKEVRGAVRRAVRISQHSLTRIRPLKEGFQLPIAIEAAVGGVNLLSWVENSRDLVKSLLLKHGGILFRDFSFKPENQAAVEFERFIDSVSGGCLEYKERSSPRLLVEGKIYTSTEYPADQSIFLHNENSYQSTFPLRIFFYCALPPERGGETPIADCRRVLQRIAPEVRDQFMRKQWMYVRNFGHGFGLPWQAVFQTSDKAAVEAYCRDRGIQVEWKPDDLLRTRAVRPAVVTHPETGEMSWFNHAIFFHVSTLEPEIRTTLLAEYQDELPTNTYYGDGSPIEPAVLDHIREAYRQETVAFPWQKGDILMLDNILAAHGRNPYSGPRKVLVGMAELTERQA